MLHSTLPIFTRSCAMLSRSRMVTVWSISVPWPTLMLFFFCCYRAQRTTTIRRSTTVEVPRSTCSR